MCNSGKFIDRNPNLRAAGLIRPCSENIGDSLQVHPKYELAETWLKAKCTKKPTTEKFRESPCLPNDTLHEALTPELQKSRFLKFREQFFEDMYLKKPELGKATQVHSIPDNITNENTTFGYKLRRSDSLYQLVLPPKTVGDVNREYIQWHEKYILSHNHYFPGEQIHRGYNNNFNPKANFGRPINVDTTGGQVKRCFSQRDRVILVKGLQKYYLDKEFGDFGKKIHKFYDAHLNDPKRIFGHPPNSNKCRLKDIVHNIDPCETNDELLEAIAYLHGQRYKILSNYHFDIFELESELRKQDTESTGFVPLKTAIETARHLHVYFNEDKMRLALSFFKLLENAGQSNERIHIDDFSKALQSRYLLPNVQYKDIKAVKPHEMDTTYRELCRDHGKPVPSGIVYRKKHDEEADNEIGPEVFDLPREKTQLQRIFADIVCVSTFEQIWNAAEQQSKVENGTISINDFRSVLRELRSNQQLAHQK